MGKRQKELWHMCGLNKFMCVQVSVRVCVVVHWLDLTLLCPLAGIKMGARRKFFAHVAKEPSPCSTFGWCPPFPPLFFVRRCNAILFHFIEGKSFPFEFFYLTSSFTCRTIPFFPSTFPLFPLFPLFLLSLAGTNLPLPNPLRRCMQIFDVSNNFLPVWGRIKKV